MKMADYNIDELVEDMNQQIENAPICVPADGEFVDECAYSRTGWAIWRHDGPTNYCTCNPAQSPADRGGNNG